jgi:hypothetical protein
MLHEQTGQFLAVFTGFFAIVNPVANMPVSLDEPN